jgi:hypothetical protein
MPPGHIFTVVDVDDLSNPSCLENLVQGSKMLGVAEHMADVKLAPILLSSTYQRTAFWSGGRHGFLQQDIAARLHGSQSRGSVLLVLGANQGSPSDLGAGEEGFPTFKYILVWNIMGSRKFQPPFLNRFSYSDEPELIRMLQSILPVYLSAALPGANQDCFNGWGHGVASTSGGRKLCNRDTITALFFSP